MLMLILFVVSLGFTLFFSAYFGFRKQPKEMWAIIIAGSLAMAFCNMDRLTRFKAPGFEAEMRLKIDEAYATLDNLRELAVNVVDPLLTLLAMQDRVFQRIPQESKIEIKEEVVQSLNQLGVSQTKIKEVTKFFDAALIQDHLVRLSNMASKSDVVRETAKNRLKELADLNSSEHLTRVDLTEITQLLGDAVNSDPKVEETFLDLKYFLENRRLRRPDTWQ